MHREVVDAMSRFRQRAAVVAAPAPGTILPGVPFVPRDAGDLIPRQRVHDPLSEADRQAALLADVTDFADLMQTTDIVEIADVDIDEVLDHADLMDHEGLVDQDEALELDEDDVVDAEIVEPVSEPLTEIVMEPAPDESLVAAEDHDEVLDPMAAIDPALIDAVARWRPRLVPVAAPQVAGPPSPERLRLMVGVLARDFGSHGIGGAASLRDVAVGPSADAPPTDPAVEPSVDNANAPWPAPETTSWPVVVPPWGAVPQGFGAAPPLALTRSA
jgi:hypothetical protein